jgi:glycosyltransferase involved in cell wall biosynthesis
VNAAPAISAVLPTRNPHLGRLRRTLDALAAQSLDRAAWELIVVDNGSEPALADLPLSYAPLRVVRETEVGLTPARLRGMREARGDVLVFVDDDNVLDAGYLAAVEKHFRSQPQLGAAGGPVVPEWESPPPAWIAPFHGLFALHEHGAVPLIARGDARAPWPEFAPVGAGLAVRRRYAEIYARELASNPRRRALDRRAGELSSGGDSDLVFTTLHAGGDVGYFPELRVTHLIPTARLAPDYLERLNRGIMRTWVRVLALHGQCPWPAIPRSTVTLRVARAWLRRRAWRSPANRVRWAGDRGQFEGQADLHDCR